MDDQKTILIVDDESDIRQALADELARAGFATLEAKNGKNALAIAANFHIDLILLDLIMPEMDGMTVLSQLRKDARSKTVPIIILTNVRANDKIIQGVVQDEPSYFLIKSDWQITDIIRKIQEILQE